MGVLSSASIGNVKALPYLPAIVDDVNNGNLAACARWLALFVATSVVTEAEATAIQGVMTATELDPSWQSQISWAVANLGRLLDEADLTAARPS